MLGLVVLATLLTSVASCFPVSEKDAQRKDENTLEETTAAPERAFAGEGETTARTDAPVSWDYVALGDSLAVGVGARRGYVDRYAAYIEADTGAQVKVINLGESGQRSSE